MTDIKKLDLVAKVLKLNGNPQVYLEGFVRGCEAAMAQQAVDKINNNKAVTAAAVNVTPSVTETVTQA